ncbi:HTH-type transcriptional regulator AdiY [Edwardsiella tarda]|nr:HTH-type transcriptional regulator AdiY [Edwardsiella tarda]
MSNEILFGENYNNPKRSYVMDLGLLNLKDKRIFEAAQVENGNVVIENLYIPALTLIYHQNGKMRISNDNGDVICRDSPGVWVLEKGQCINLMLEEVDGHLSFEVLEIPAKIASELYKITLNNLTTDRAISKEHNRKIICSPDFPASKDVFDSLIERLNHEDNNSEVCHDEHHENINEQEVYLLLCLLSLVLKSSSWVGLIERSVIVSVKEKVYNIIYSDPEQQWKVAGMAGKLFMSSSTLKRKLAAEGATFSGICLAARMNFAAKLLRTGKYSVSTIAVSCGYYSTSYFIQCFKKSFNITPLAFMRAINH